MSDRELLELAAKAAGYVVDAEAQRGRDEAGYGRRGLFIKSESTAWNPLTDDGHALRLAVKRGINLSFSMPDRVCAWCDAIDDWVVEMYADHTTREDATRRAITRAAAEIGRWMA